MLFCRPRPLHPLCHLFAASVASSAPPPTSTITLDPAFVVAVASAVQAALTPATPQASGISPPSFTGAACLPGLANVPSSSGGVPVHAHGLEQRTSSFLASGVSPFSVPSSLQPVVPQGRPLLSVPSFMSMFATPRSVISSPAFATGAFLSVPSSVSSTSLGLPLSFQQPFVLPSLLRFRKRLLAKFLPGSSSIWGICFPRTFWRRNQNCRKSTSAVNWSSHLRRRNIVERSMTLSPGPKHSPSSR